MTGTRKLHIEESMEVLDPDCAGNILPTDPNPADGRQKLISCKYFNLELIGGRAGSVPVDLQGESFSALTCLNGPITAHSDDWSFELAALETLLIPAISGKYQVTFTNEARALLAYTAGA